jgi:diguanylate cyclase (GGDEF)-like protein
MKWNKDLRGEFSVFVFCSDTQLGARLKAPLGQEGFEVFWMTDSDSLVERMKSSPGHVLVFSLSSLIVSLEDFVKGMLLLSPELRFVPLVLPQELQAVMEYREFNFAPPVLINEAMTPNLCWTVDEVIKSLYVSYQNEQILEYYEQEAEERRKLQLQVQTLSDPTRHLDPVLLSEDIQYYENFDSKSEATSAFLRRISIKLSKRGTFFKAIYFKYLPTVQTFAVLQSQGLIADEIQGLGGKLSQDEIKDLDSIFLQNQIPQQVQHLLIEGLGVGKFLSKAIYLDGYLDGFFVFWADGQGLLEQDYLSDFLVFKLQYEKLHFRKQAASAEYVDPVTELHGASYFKRKLKEEVARARRIQRGVSILKVAIDNFDEIESKMGRSTQNQVLKIMANLALKTSRINDLVTRTGPNEVSLILPHSGRKGGTVRAERLRRLLEKSFQQAAGDHITVSCGIAEYPSHCKDAESLESCCAQALEYIRSKGVNKVCLFQPEKSFVPEFEVPAQ